MIRLRWCNHLIMQHRYVPWCGPWPGMKSAGIRCVDLQSAGRSHQLSGTGQVCVRGEMNYS